MKSHIDALKAHRFVPDDAVEHRHDDLDLVYYTADRLGHPVVVGYEGRRKKPSFHYSFPHSEGLKKYVKQWLQGRRDELEYKRKKQAEIKAFKTSLVVGSILHGSSGWEQTNAYFFQVVERKTDKTVVIRKIEHQLSPNPDDHQYNSMAGKVIPKPDHFVEREKPLTKRVAPGDTIKIESFLHLKPWDGKPKYCSWYG